MKISNNTVELLGHYGGDETHALSAWTSTARDLPEEKRARIGELLKRMASEGHGTPFEKSTIHFLVKSDVATHIQLLKHRVGVSVNTESARYKELSEDKFYMPLDWPELELLKLHKHLEQCNEYYHSALKELTPKLGRKRAKETARYYLPYATQLWQDVSFNWRSFFHFYALRHSEHAQREISDMAEIMLDLIKGIEGNPFQKTIEAFGL